MIIRDKLIHTLFIQRLKCRSLYTSTLRTMRVSVGFLLSLAVLGNNLFRVTTFGPRAGPYDILPKLMVTCEDEGTGQVHFGNKIDSKGGRVYTYTNVAYILVPWDNTMKLQMLSNGVYRPRYITHSFKGCEKMMRVGHRWAADFFGAAGYNFTSCPLPVGNYSVKDWVVNIKLNNVPSMVYNTYKAIMTFTKSGTKVGCFILYGDCVPKTMET